MRTTKKSLGIWIALLAMASGSLVTAPPALAQCMVGAPALMSYATYRVVRRQLQDNLGSPMPYICQRVAGTMERGCYPTSGQTTSAYSSLTASAYFTATSPSCQWQCMCATQSPTFTIGPAEGLPVELMTFDVEK